MNRKEIYAFISEHNLKETINNIFGKNFTQVSSAKLQEVIDNYSSKAGKAKEEPVETVSPYEAACLIFLGVLSSAGVLNDLLAKLEKQ